MSQAIQTVKRAEGADAKLYESLALRGDISGLDPKSRIEYYAQLCERLGLDPYTQPFLPLKLNGKEVLYATRGATDQLARLHNVRREIVARERLDDVWLVTVRATLPSGRAEDSQGAVPIGAAKGEALANALMKAETKAKRRATLALLGLGMLDESELETIPDRAKQEISVALPVKQIEAGDGVQQAAQIWHGVQGGTQVITDGEGNKIADAEARRGVIEGQILIVASELGYSRKVVDQMVNQRFEIDDRVAHSGLEALNLDQLDEVRQGFLDKRDRLELQSKIQGYVLENDKIEMMENLLKSTFGDRKIGQLNRTELADLDDKLQAAF